MKIKIINPNTSEEMTRAIGAAGESVARPGTQITAVSPRFGPASIESYYDDYLSIPGLLEEVQRGEAEQCGRLYYRLLWRPWPARGTRMHYQAGCRHRRSLSVYGLHAGRALFYCDGDSTDTHHARRNGRPATAFGKK